MMKILACDYDRTLYFPDKGISPEDIEAVRRFQISGNLFVIATGRSLSSVMDSASRFGITPDYCIVSNGSALFRKDKLLYRQTIRKEIQERIFEKAEANHVRLYEFGCGKTSFEYETAAYEDLFETVRSECLKRFEESTEDGTYGIVQIGFAFENTDAKNACLDDLRKTEGITVHPNGMFIDITAEDLSKEKALQFLEILTGADRIFSAGDDWNDLGMLKRYNGFLMESCEEELKKLILRRTSSVSECISFIMDRDND